MRTLVTGATGFVGSAVVRSLLAAGHEIRALVRPATRRDNCEGLDIDAIEGDLCDPESLVRATKSCDNLFHVAADYRLWSANPQDFYRTNVEGTKQLLAAAERAGIRRIVYTSSVAALGLNADGTPADETTDVSVDDMIGHYKRSKYLAERAVLSMINERGLPVVIVNPSTPIGPRDIKPTPTGAIIVDAVCGRMPAYVDTGLNIVHVDDVAKGHMLAFEKGLIGERYILGGENLSLKCILDVVAEITGTTPPKLRLPHQLVLPIAYISEALAKLQGTTPRVSVDGVRMSMKKMYFSSAKAQQQLGYQSRPARLAIADAIDWFNANGYFLD